MCGIFGLIAPPGHDRRVSDSHARRLRDLLERRGPDDAGEWSSPAVYLANRRLAILDPTPAGRQPMVGEVDPATGAPRFVLVYNGELYNDAELRTDLEARGHVFRTGCDTETALHALMEWGEGALPRLRGMFGLAFYDALDHTLLLARDPLGVKPLYMAAAGNELVFASEPAPILGHPGVTPSPNPRMLSAYLTTIRTVLDDQTMFDGVLAIRPGERALVSFACGAPRVERASYWTSPLERSGGDAGFGEAVSRVAEAIEDSLSRHLRSDAPTCCLLSGGIDSTILATLAAERTDGLLTYCSGAEDGDLEGNDLAFAERVARGLGSRHAAAVIDQNHFSETWPRMVSELGVPLSTPNEVAILAVASRLRADGCKVTISGEGADELFAGYDMILDIAARAVEADPAGARAGDVFLSASAWLPIHAKPAAIIEGLWDSIEHDAWLRTTTQRMFEDAALEAGATGLSAHLRLQRRINLTGLLQRLDTATMLASVEGRTPFADAEVASLAESLPMRFKAMGEEELGEAIDGGVSLATRTITKRVLREAFRDRVPPEVVQRPKKSFPLPFQSWVGEHAGAVRHSELCAEVFTPAAIEMVATQPAEAWNLAWPMINLALWGERWWGRGDRLGECVPEARAADA